MYYPLCHYCDGFYPQMYLIFSVIYSTSTGLELISTVYIFSTFYSVTLLYLFQLSFVLSICYVMVLHWSVSKGYFFLLWCIEIAVIFKVTALGIQ